MRLCIGKTIKYENKISTWMHIHSAVEYSGKLAEQVFLPRDNMTLKKENEKDKR